jgi:SAM-dependent methyltransferase
MPALSSQEKWPKVLPPLTEEQQRISHAFMKLWHEELPKKYSSIERFNHQFPVKFSTRGFGATLEIGAGLGEHIEYEELSAEQRRNYHALELRPNMAAVIREKFPDIQVIEGDCQARLDFPDGSFDRVLAVHVLEHLPNLPACIREMHRLLNKETGQFLVVIPTEGSPAYSLARKISAERIYKKRFGGDYSWFYKREHINFPHEIREELDVYFETTAVQWFPFNVLPFQFCNLCIGISLRPRKNVASY